MKPAYEYLADGPDVFRRIGQLAAQTVIFDIEPLVASWDSSQDALDRGLVEVLAEVEAIDSVHVVCFATNSARLPSAIPSAAGLRVEYLVSARKPLRVAPYRAMPQPGVVIGDQVATDGILARRLGYTFLHYRPRIGSMPAGPRLLFGCGDLLRPLLFSRDHKPRRPPPQNGVGM